MSRTVDGLPLDAAQLAEWSALRREVASDAQADAVFALCYVHDQERWVPLDLFATAERDPLRHGEQYATTAKPAQ